MKSFDLLFNTAYYAGESIKENVCNITNEDPSKVTQLILDIMIFMNNVDLFYRNFIYKRTLKQVSVSNVVFEIKSLKEDEDQEFWKAYQKMKRLRNAAVHSVNLTKPVLNYFERDFTRVKKVARRLDLILNTVEKDLNCL